MSLLHSRSGPLLRALAGASIAASWPGLFAVPFMFTAPGALLIPLLCFAIAFGHGLVLGLPLYLGAERCGRANIWLAALIGACVGMVPVLIFATISYFQNPSAPYQDWLGGMLSLFAFLGVCGGLTFFALVSNDSASED
jgi:hypothetical protein